MANYFGFIDETGVLSPQAQQRFFALGMLKIENTATLYEQLVVLKEKAQSKTVQDKISQGAPKPRQIFEFKFASITTTSHTFYYDLIDLFFKFKEISFCCLVFDKLNPDFDMSKYFPSIWEAYISYAKLLVKKNIDSNEQLCVIADYLGRPKSSTKYFEKELTLLPNIYNVCMIESHASLYIQLVDVLIGCIVYDFKINRGVLTQIDKFKKKVCDFLKAKLNRDCLAENFTARSPNYFSVWEFKPT
jgi:hypothetical protein